MTTQPKLDRILANLRTIEALEGYTAGKWASRGVSEVENLVIIQAAKPYTVVAEVWESDQAGGWGEQKEATQSASLISRAPLHPHHARALRIAIEALMRNAENDARQAFALAEIIAAIPDELL